MVTPTNLLKCFSNKAPLRRVGREIMLSGDDNHVDYPVTERVPVELTSNTAVVNKISSFIAEYRLVHQKIRPSLMAEFVRLTKVCRAQLLAWEIGSHMEHHIPLQVVSALCWSASSAYSLLEDTRERNPHLRCHRHLLCSHYRANLVRDFRSCCCDNQQS